MDYNAFFVAVNKNFENYFVKAYKSVKKVKRNVLLKHMASFYRRWYYSALIEDTQITPANLCDIVYHMQAGKQDSHYCALTPVLNSFSRLSKMGFKNVVYTLDEHPIINDIRIVLDSCMPDFQLDDDDRITSSHEMEVISQLSICDPFYLDYIMIICAGLQLVAKTPSIHSNYAQVTKYANEFLDMPPKEQFSIVVEEAIACCTRFLSTMVPFRGTITRDYIKNLLLEPVDTDSIFRHIYSALGFSLEDVMDIQYDDIMDEMYATMLSNTFYLGIFIDRYFFTPFGFYLRLINPGYLLPYSMEKEMAFAMEATEEADDLSIAMFSPCSHSTLSRMGAEYFEIQDWEEPLALNQDADMDKFIQTLASGVPLNITAAMFEQYFEEFGSIVYMLNVYEVKVSVAGKKQLWKKIELSEDNTLHELYLEICTEFHYNINMNYSFFKDTCENPFLEYTSPANKKNGTNAANITIKDLSLPLKHKFLLVIYDVFTIYKQYGDVVHSDMEKMEIQILRINRTDSGEIYPRTKSAGSLFKKYEEN